jgi:xanthine dehydrogenase YagT iron-sulfur-binding subunit
MAANDEPDDRDESAWAMSRRRFLRGVGVVGAGAAMADPAVLGAQDKPASPAAEAPAADAARKVTLAVNGQNVDVTVEPRVTLLGALRDYADPAITGPKLVCGAGTCGACTVLLDGKPVYSCLCLAADVAGKKITTVEGLGTPDKMNPVQAAFCEHDG